MSLKARRLVTLYLVERVNVGLPSEPIGDQFRIVWRWRRSWGEYGFSARVGRPSARLTPRREIVPARKLAPGDTVYWLSRHGNERGRRVSEVWWSEETVGAVCVLFDGLSLGDTFWPGEKFARKKQAT
ncbi:hypothetical protein [Actinomadura chokoriensis]|uniref:hypothetical protein n=1 Tax=Actinomadura chokoriensis TaxID=454156 RepID=UPI0031F7E2CA